MKTIEEKARAYDSIIEKANKMHSENCEACRACIEELIPELAESEGEKVRKEIIDFLKLPHPQFVGKRDHEKWIAWLEKQGQKDILEDAILDGNEDGLIAETIRYKHEKQSKQKLDKVEPKFKVGDWIINPRTGLIKHIKNVLLCDNNGNYEFESSSMSIDSVDNSFHLWTIQDAKDGDVLYINNTVSESIMIYKSFNNGLIKKYASYNKFGFEGEHYLTLNDGYITPATKEQCTELFLKMHEAGYEWDSEKKELKKIEQKPVWSEENKSIIEEVVSYLINYSNIVESKEDADRIEYLIDKIQDICPHQKQEWSEEDEMFVHGLIRGLAAKRDIHGHTTFSSDCIDITKTIDWLQFLKNRVQPKQEWSEEDSYYRNHIIQIIEEINNAPLKRGEDWEAYINWLKSLRPQNNITDEELTQAKKNAYNDALDKIEYHSGEPTFDDGWSAAIDYIRKKSLRPQKCLIPSEKEIEKAAQEWDSKANFNPFYMTMENDKPTGVKQSITTHKESFKAGVNWILKSLKVQPKQKWSDVDKDILSRIIDDLKFLRDTVSIDPKYAVSIIDMEREITWLNSLRPQNKWKPSDEQMEALDWQVENTSVSSWQYKATKELMEDLKKLKEE